MAGTKLTQKAANNALPDAQWQLLGTKNTLIRVSTMDNTGKINLCQDSGSRVNEVEVRTIFVSLSAVSRCRCVAREYYLPIVSPSPPPHRQRKIQTKHIIIGKVRQ